MTFQKSFSVEMRCGQSYLGIMSETVSTLNLWNKTGKGLPARISAVSNGQILSAMKDLNHLMESFRGQNVPIVQRLVAEPAAHQLVTWTNRALNGLDSRIEKSGTPVRRAVNACTRLAVHDHQNHTWILIIAVRDNHSILDFLSADKSMTISAFSRASKSGDGHSEPQKVHSSGQKGGIPSKCRLPEKVKLKHRIIKIKHGKSYPR
jgi:hypothetical protein